MPRLGFWEILLIVFAILLLFGANRIPEVMRSLARGFRGFKDELKSEEKSDAPSGGPASEKPKAG
jgi:sec-independent protein translocase protein TatA